MKRLIKNQIFALIIVLSVGMAQVLFAATDPQKLTDKVENAIGNYYLETFNIYPIVGPGPLNSLAGSYLREPSDDAIAAFISELPQASPCASRSRSNCVESP